MTGCGAVFITASSHEEAEKIAVTLVAKKLAACAQIISEIKSFFWWQGRLCKEKEVLLMAKTTQKLFPLLVDEVKAIHSYEVPEIIMLPIQDAASDYVEWIREVTAEKPS